MENVTWTITEISNIEQDNVSIENNKSSPIFEKNNELLSDELPSDELLSDELPSDELPSDELPSDELSLLLEDEIEDLAKSATVKDLERILAYHSLAKQGRRKIDMARAIVFFEADPQNYLAVQERNRLWDNLDELSQHPYLRRFVSF